MMVNTQASDLAISMENCKLSETTRVSSSSPISILTDELLIEILCRLGSPKHAVQCKLVSKLWLSLLNTDSWSSDFMRRWRRINHKEEDELHEILLAQYEGGKEVDHTLDDLSFKSFEFLPEKDPICVLGTWSDLVLCEPNRVQNKVYYVCNPFTKQYTALPPLRPLSDSEYLIGPALYVYDDEDTVRFKVMNVTHDQKNSSTRVETFSSEDSTWRLVHKWTSTGPTWIYHYVVYNGMIVWLLEYHSRITLLLGIKIDPDQHDECRTRTIPIPPNSPKPCVGVFGEHLRLAVKVGDEYANLRLKIWDLDEHNEGWKLVHDLGLSDMDDSEDLSKLRSCLQRRKTEVESFGLDGDSFCLSCTLEDEDEDEDESRVVLFLCDLWNRTVKTILRLPSVVDNTIYLSMPCWPSHVPLSFTTIES